MELILGEKKGTGKKKRKMIEPLSKKKNLNSISSSAST
jgi:hypothetical protein